MDIKDILPGAVIGLVEQTETEQAIILGQGGSAAYETAVGLALDQQIRTGAEAFLVYLPGNRSDVMLEHVLRRRGTDWPHVKVYGLMMPNEFVDSRHEELDGLVTVDTTDEGAAALVMAAACDAILYLGLTPCACDVCHYATMGGVPVQALSPLTLSQMHGDGLCHVDMPVDITVRLHGDEPRNEKVLIPARAHVSEPEFGPEFPLTHP